MQTRACFPARCEGGCTSMRSESKILAGKGRALLVVNPCAGRTKGRLYADLLETHLHNAGVPVIRCETTAEENGANYAASAALAGCRRIFCIGGDGTLNAVINGMLGAGANLPITYIPAGTTNDFARTLKLPRRIGDMRRVLALGRDVAIDAGRLTTATSRTSPRSARSRSARMRRRAA